MIKTNIKITAKDYPEFLDENYIEQICLSDLFIETDSYIDRSKFEIHCYSYCPDEGNIFIGLTHNQGEYRSHIDLVYNHELSELCIMLRNDYHPIESGLLWYMLYSEKELVT